MRGNCNCAEKIFGLECKLSIFSVDAFKILANTQTFSVQYVIKWRHCNNFLTKWPHKCARKSSICIHVSESCQWDCFVLSWESLLSPNVPFRSHITIKYGFFFNFCYCLSLKFKWFQLIATNLASVQHRSVLWDSPYCHKLKLSTFLHFSCLHLPHPHPLLHFL